MQFRTAPPADSITNDRVGKGDEVQSNDELAYKKKLQPQVVLQPPINIPNIPNTPNIRQEVRQATPQIVRKILSLLTPPSTVDSANIPLPSSSASEDEQSTKKKKWFSFSDDEEEEERRQYRITHNLRKRLRGDKEYLKTMNLLNFFIDNTSDDTSKNKTRVNFVLE